MGATRTDSLVLWPVMNPWVRGRVRVRVRVRNILSDDLGSD